MLWELFHSRLALALIVIVCAYLAGAAVFVFTFEGVLADTPHAGRVRLLACAALCALLAVTMVVGAYLQ